MLVRRELDPEFKQDDWGVRLARGACQISVARVVVFVLFFFTDMVNLILCCFRRTPPRFVVCRCARQ